MLRKIHHSLLRKKVVSRMRQTELVKRIVTPTNQIRMKKCACNEARSSEEEDFGMRNSRRKCDFEHTNEE